MKNGGLFWTSVLVVFGFSARADVGLGVIIGSPTGISGKYTFSSDHAIDGALAWDLNDDHVHFHGEYLWLKDKGLRLDSLVLDWYFGLGGRLVLLDKDNNRRGDDDDYKLGVRGPIGIGYTFADPRIEVFGELSLILNLLEETDVDLDGGIGARFHF